VVLEAGDLTLHLLPGRTRLSSSSHEETWKVRIGKLRRMAARAMKPLDPETSLASSFLAMRPAYVRKMSHVGRRGP
jgi:hypothetical protein